MELMDATWRPLFLLCNNGSCFFVFIRLTKTKLILIYLQHMPFINGIFIRIYMQSDESECEQHEEADERKALIIKSV